MFMWDLMSTTNKCLCEYTNVVFQVIQFYSYTKYPDQDTTVYYLLFVVVKPNKT